MGKVEDEIVELVGPPGSKGSKYAKGDAEDMADGGDDEAAEGDDKGNRDASEVSAMDEYTSVMDDKSSTSEEKLDAFKKLLAIVQ